ncbi:MAG: hypothetical protein LBM98_11020 [Oscillospiraceae bacterium]|nr:hypothetical protein [Oscillospiraceae bacterium]
MQHSAHCAGETTPPLRRHPSTEGIGGLDAGYNPRRCDGTPFVREGGRGGTWVTGGGRRVSQTRP